MSLSDVANYYHESVKPALGQAWDKMTGLSRLNERGVDYFYYSVPNKNGNGWDHKDP